METAAAAPAASLKGAAVRGADPPQKGAGKLPDAGGQHRGAVAVQLTHNAGPDGDGAAGADGSTDGEDDQDHGGGGQLQGCRKRPAAAGEHGRAVQALQAAPISGPRLAGAVKRKRGGSEASASRRWDGCCKDTSHQRVHVTNVHTLGQMASLSDAAKAGFGRVMTTLKAETIETQESK